SRSALHHAQASLYALANSAATDEIRAVESELAPLTSEHRDAFSLDPRLHARLQRLEQTVDLDPDSAWVVRRYLQDFERAGVALTGEDADRLRALNTEISTLQTEFSQRAAAGMSAAAVHVQDPAEL